VLASARAFANFDRLGGVPGIGRILAMTIVLEVGDIQRFSSAEKFASYCRMVKSARTSNGKKKGENNAKCGNRYLAWAFVEAANFIRRYDPRAQRWHDRKAAKTHPVLAKKALGCKIAKAANTTASASSARARAPAPHQPPAAEQELRESIRQPAKGVEGPRNSLRLIGGGCSLAST
jgi:transposase